VAKISLPVAGCYFPSLFRASAFLWHSFFYVSTRRKHIFKVNQTKIESEKRFGGRQHNVCLLKQNVANKKREAHMKEIKRKLKSKSLKTMVGR